MNSKTAKLINAFGEKSGMNPNQINGLKKWWNTLSSKEKPAQRNRMTFVVKK